MDEIERTRLMCSLFYEQTKEIFDQNGLEAPSQTGIGLRNRLNFALGYLGSGEKAAISLANKIVQNCENVPCHFSCAVALQLILRFGDLLQPEARAFLDAYLISRLDDFKTPELDFIAVNDNYPCLATVSAILGGERYQKPELYEIGRARLNQLEALLMRRGFSSEFNSPTYTPIQILCLAEIANNAKDPSVAKQAEWCEQRIWSDIILHYHPGLSQMVGPYSRAYTVDSMASIHQSVYLLYAVFGDAIKVNPLRQLFLGKPDSGDAIHGSIPNMQKCAVWFPLVKYHLPAELSHYVTHKDFPFEVTASVETAPSSDAPPLDDGSAFPFVEYPAGESIVKSYMTENYGLGTATKEWHNGNQTDSFHLIYKKGQVVEKQSDIGAVYLRYLINGGEPDPSKTLLADMGRKLCMQEKGTALAVYKPRIFNGRSRNYENVTSMKLSAIITDDCDPLLENIGSKTAAFVKLRNVYIAFYPLTVTNLGRKNMAQVEKVNGTTMISFYNYSGPARNFSKKRFIKVQNGIAVIVKESSEYESFSDFVEEVRKTTVQDELYQWELTRMALVRRISVTTGETSFACAYSPYSEGIQYMTVNGTQYYRPSGGLININC